MVALLNGGTKSVPHGITNIDATVTFSRIYATASDPIALTYISVPDTYQGQNTGIQIDAVNVNISTDWDATAYTTCLAVLEFFKG